jgi:hypothetical protein
MWHIVQKDIADVPWLNFHVLSDNKEALDESDRFLMNPLDFVGEVFGNLSSFSHIVLFESEERRVLQLLLRDSFQEVISHFTLVTLCLFCLKNQTRCSFYSTFSQVTLTAITTRIEGRKEPGHMLLMFWQLDCYTHKWAAKLLHS